jgi:hypothetical protein
MDRNVQQKAQPPLLEEQQGRDDVESTAAGSSGSCGQKEFFFTSCFACTSASASASAEIASAEVTIF